MTTSHPVTEPACDAKAPAITPHPAAATTDPSHPARLYEAAAGGVIIARDIAVGLADLAVAAAEAGNDLNARLYANECAAATRACRWLASLASTSSQQSRYAAMPPTPLWDGRGKPLVSPSDSTTD